MSGPSTLGLKPIPFDLESHHALGGGSYVFKENYPGYLQSLLLDVTRPVVVNIAIQPNSPPHIGTLCSLGLAFVVANRLKALDLEVTIVCDLGNHTQGAAEMINGVRYPRSLESTGVFAEMLPHYRRILETLGERYNISYSLRLEEELFGQPRMPEVIQSIMTRRHEIAKILAPTTGGLHIRAA